MPPLGIFSKRLPTLLLYSHKNRVVRSYLGVELVIFQERVGHFPLARSLFQYRIPCGREAGQTIRKNLAKQRVIIPIRSHPPPIPSYLTNFGALNLEGITICGKLVKLSRSTLPWVLKPFMIRNFSARVSTSLLTWPYLDSGFLSLEGSVLGHLFEAIYYGPDPVLVGG